MESYLEENKHQNGVGAETYEGRRPSLEQEGWPFLMQRISKYVHYTRIARLVWPSAHFPGMR